jgi:hypothetical protein
MRIFIIIVIGAISYVLFDLQTSRRTSPTKNSPVETGLTHENKKKKVKKLKRKYKNRKYKKRNSYIRKELSLKGSSPKANRFTNQKSLRRMYRNG